MFDKLFGDDAFQAATGALNAAALRQQVIADNLANVNTPGYKRQDVSFEANLEEALQQRSNPTEAAFAPSLATVQPRVITLGTTSERADGNNVNVESENVALAANAIRYDTLIEAVRMNLHNLNTVISGR